MATITKDLIEINLSTDELMLSELERRDGIYSFIFHELEVPKLDMPTTNISSTKLINGNHTTTIARNALTTTTTAKAKDTSNVSNDINIGNANDSHDNDNLPNERNIKTESLLMQQQTTTNTATAIATITVETTTTTRTISFTTPVTTSFINTFPSNVSSALAITSTGAATTTTTSLPSLFTTSPPPPTTSSSYYSTLGLSNTLPCLPSLSGLSMRSYHDYLKTWHPPPSLVYDNPKLYAYMANCGFRVRAATPRFSHITAPLVRNRRHALKETPEYKREWDVCMCAPVADLRALFPQDPDVHAPFAVTMEVTTTTMLGEDEIGSVEFDGDCCGDVVLMTDETVL